MCVPGRYRRRINAAPDTGERKAGPSAKRCEWKKKEEEIVVVTAPVEQRGGGGGSVRER